MQYIQTSSQICLNNDRRDYIDYCKFTQGHIKENFWGLVKPFFNSKNVLLLFKETVGDGSAKSGEVFP